MTAISVISREMDVVLCYWGQVSAIRYSNFFEGYIILYLVFFNSCFRDTN